MVKFKIVDKAMMAINIIIFSALFVTGSVLIIIKIDNTSGMFLIICAALYIIFVKINNMDNEIKKIKQNEIKCFNDIIRKNL